MKKTASILRKGLLLLFVLLGFLALFSAKWCVHVYGDIGFDAVLYTMLSNLNGVSGELISSYLEYAVPPTLFATALVCFLLLFRPKARLLLSVRKLQIPIYPFNKSVSAILSVVISVALIVSAANIVGAMEYGRRQLVNTKFIEEEYVFPQEVSIEFPEKKRNLIYIVMESMETSFFSQEQSGGLESNVIPELYSLAENNINFSENSAVGGLNTVTGASWTIGALVAQTAGIPLKVPADQINSMDTQAHFLPGAYTLNDILAENGYRQSFMCGSNSVFGGRKLYFTQHGVTTIYDHLSAQGNGIIPQQYWDGWWGMEDKHLYNYAKQQLSVIGNSDEPFAFFMLTVDTHHVGGKLCTLCGDAYEEQYENVYACASKQVNEFIEWLAQQDFYENTTIVIVGDHKSMDDYYFVRNVSGDYTRRLYNCFLNCPISSEYTKNRVATQLDMFPTTLAALGCTIEGEQLGLGVNLFSGQQTLAEKYTLETFNEELAGKSLMYDYMLLRLSFDE